MEFEDWQAMMEEADEPYPEGYWNLVRVGWDGFKSFGDESVQLCEAEGCYKLGRYNYGGIYACCLPHAERAAM